MDLISNPFFHEVKPQKRAEAKALI